MQILEYIAETQFQSFLINRRMEVLSAYLLQENEVQNGAKSGVPDIYSVWADNGSVSE